MESLIHADIFFVITSVAVVIVTLLAVIALVYAIKILRDVKKVSTDVREHSKAVLSDVDEMRRYFKQEGMRLMGAAGSLGRLFGRGRKPRKKAEADDEAGAE